MLEQVVGEASLFRTIKKNDLEELKHLITKVTLHSNLEAPSLVEHASCRLRSSKDTLLHHASQFGHFQIVKYIVEELKWWVDVENIDGKTPLHVATQNDQSVVVKYLLEKGANVNSVKRGDWTALMLCCTKPQSLCTLNLLLNAGADPWFLNKDGWSAFHIAARTTGCHQPEVLQTILEKLGNSEEKLKMINCPSKNGRTPLHSAVMHGNAEVVDFLFSCYEQLTNVGDCLWNRQDNCGSSPVMDSVRFGFPKIFRKLISKTLNVSKALMEENGSGMNCLHIASQAGQNEMINILVKEFSMDLNKFSGMPLFMSPLHFAIKEGQLTAVKTLCTLGADVTSRSIDDRPRTCLQMSEEYGKRDILIYLMSLHENCDVEAVS